MASWLGSMTIIGNLTREPLEELKFSPAGKAYIKFAIAVSKADKGGANKKTYFVDVTCFDTLAENVAGSLKKGDQVIVYGEPDPDEWTDKNDPQKTNRRLGILAENVGVALRYNAAEVVRTERTGGKAKAEQAQQEAPF